MKLAKSIKMIAAVALALPVMTSCLKNDGGNYPEYYSPNYILTVKPVDADGDFYLQLDDKTTAKVTNLSKSPFEDKEVRAFAYLTEVEGEHDCYDKAVKVSWMDSILTKNPVDMAIVDGPADGNEETAADDPEQAVDYGDNGVDVLTGSWVTLVEDGYLNIHFRTRSGYNSKHWLNLLVNTDPDDPYLVEFRQKTEGDAWELREGFVAFRLKDMLPDTEGETVELTLKWKSIQGQTKTVTFDYCTPEKK